MAGARHRGQTNPDEFKLLGFKCRKPVVGPPSSLPLQLVYIGLHCFWVLDQNLLPKRASTWIYVVHVGKAVFVKLPLLFTKGCFKNPAIAEIGLSVSHICWKLILYLLEVDLVFVGS